MLSQHRWAAGYVVFGGAVLGFSQSSTVSIVGVGVAAVGKHVIEGIVGKHIAVDLFHPTGAVEGVGGGGTISIRS